MSLNVFRTRIVSAIPALLLLFCLLNNLQGRDIPVDDKGNATVKKYAFYNALKGETAYSIAWKFNLSLDDFFKYNPELKRGIHEGDQVRIPTPFSIRQEGKAGGKQLVKYEVGRKETLYSIAKMFNTTQEEILKINPSFKGVLIKGTILTIPGPAVTEVTSQKEEIPQKETVNPKSEVPKKDNLSQNERVAEKVSSPQNVIVTQKDPEAPKDIVSKAAGLFKKVFTPKKDIPQQIAAPNNEIQTTKVVVKQIDRDVVTQKIVAPPMDMAPPKGVSATPKGNTAQIEVLASKDIPSSKEAPAPKAIIVPAEVFPQKTVQPSIHEETAPYSEYTIVKGDNYFQLLQKFGLSQAELEQLNPPLKEGIKLGMVIKIPLTKSAGLAVNHEPVREIKSVPVKPDYSPVYQTPAVAPDLSKTFDVGIFLPFCQNLNDSARISLRSNSFVEFYSGVLLATEKLEGSGLKLKLFVYDTYHDSGVVNYLVKKPEFLSLDLIIGPVYPNDQKIITELSFKNHIPVVSPLSPDTRFVSITPGYYLINPGKRVRLASTADYIAANFTGQNIILLNHGSNTEDEIFLSDRLSRRPGNVKSYNILTEEAAGLEELVNDSLENIFVLAEGSEANVSVAMGRLNTLSKTHKIRVIGLQEFTKMQSIDVESFHNTNLHFVAPYFVNYTNPRVNDFIEKYRLAFASEPTQYSFQGYDVALHFMASLGKAGKGFPSTNPNPGVELLQAEYDFSKTSPLGGYINRMLYVIEYTNSYDIRVIEKIKGAVGSNQGADREE